jgi:hypothetical protein
MHKTLRPHVWCIDFSSYKSVTFTIAILFYFVKKLLFKYKIPVMFYCSDTKVMFFFTMPLFLTVDLQTKADAQAQCVGAFLI